MTHSLYILDDSPWFEWIRLHSTDSTIDFLKHYRPVSPKDMILVTADFQTAGRGQAGNSWESEAGKNLLFGLLFHPREVEANRQFILSQAVALSICETLSDYAEDIRIKWPNDIYWRDKKISGTLSECTISGSHVGSCILGTGINLNQREFVSDAPNPVSLSQILGRDIDADEVLGVLLRRFEVYLGMVNEGRYDEVASLYSAALYRRSGRHAYKDAGGDFMAELECIEPDGHLVLRRSDGSLSRYAFKEVKYVL